MQTQIKNVTTLRDYQASLIDRIYHAHKPESSNVTRVKNMNPPTIFQKIFRILFGQASTTQILILTRSGKWIGVGVACPISFSELDELFGEGNWKL